MLRPTFRILPVIANPVVGRVVSQKSLLHPPLSVLAPAPAHVKVANQRPGTRDRHGPRDSNVRGDTSAQLTPPVSRRASQQMRDSGIPSHPYAAAPAPTLPSGFRPNNGYDRHSPVPGARNGGHVGRNDASDSVVYGTQAQGIKNFANSRDDTTGTGPRDVIHVRGMAVFDSQMQGPDDMEDDRHPKKRAFFASLFCCRA
ncbi:hypothetical protein EDD17DRAFT_1839128 [Pisolithus thermaeus]|nr:hypothetical protein EV401DRAFT_2096948 [Pisolithus croceorrhizus]KAI6159467.1 hypothetical protein EDD17DRAFT_1839128 [Pisolithus thermaeus]